MEYMARRRLAALGFQDNMDNLDCITAEALLHIDAEVHALEAEEQKKMISSKGRAKRK